MPLNTSAADIHHDIQASEKYAINEKNNKRGYWRPCNGNGNTEGDKAYGEKGWEIKK